MQCHIALGKRSVIVNMQIKIIFFFKKNVVL